MDFNEACLNYPIIILIIDPETGEIVNANKMASQIYGYSIKELCNLNINKINILTKDQIKHEMDIAKKENRNYFHFPHKTKNNEIIEMEVESFPTKIENKTYLFSTIRPCKDKNYFTNLADKYFNESSDSIIILDQNLRIINFNKAFIKTFNSRKKIIGKKITQYFETRDEKKLYNIEKSISKGLIVNESISFSFFDYEFSHFNIFAIPTFFRNNFFGAIITLKNNSLEIIKQIEIAEDLKKALSRAEKFKEEKEEFFTRMSHNMKTPLTAIISYSEFGLNEHSDIKKKQYFKQINQSASYLLGLVNDILNVNILEKNIIRFNNLPISKYILIEKILGIIEPQIKVKNIKLITNFDKKIWPYHKFDILRLEQIYLNILQNAVDFSPPNSSITWTKKYLYDENKKPYFYNEISDNGIGISKNFQQIMFNPYTTEDVNSKKNGLGLAIVKNLIEQLNGKIWCKSIKNNGTTVFFTIPANEISEEEYNSFIESKYNNMIFNNKKVLICDDNKINTKIIEKILLSSNIECYFASNGKEALEKTKSNNFDAIIMDIQMPIMNGYEAAINIRKFNKIIPIIALSTNFLDKDILEAKKSGMNDYISKPIDKDSLLKTLSKHLN